VTAARVFLSNLISDQVVQVAVVQVASRRITVHLLATRFA